MIDPEKNLREIWTAKGVPIEKQNELLASIEAAAQPGARVGVFQTARHLRPPLGLQTVPLAKVQRGDNDRTVFDQDGLIELAASIKEHGVKQPPIYRLRYKCGNDECAIPLHPDQFFHCAVCPACGTSEHDYYYEIVAGERRTRAATLAGLTEIKALVEDIDDETASAIMLTENTGRKDLDPVDEAKAYARRVKEYSWSDEEIARKAGASVERVKSRLRLSTVRPEILRLVRSGNFPVGHAEILADLDANRQMIAARPLIDGKRLNRREFRAVVDALIAQQQQEAMFDMNSLTTPSTAPDPALPTMARVETANHIPTVREAYEKRKPAHGGELLFNYYQKLVGDGYDEEARVVGSVLLGLAELNYMRIPYITVAG